MGLHLDRDHGDLCGVKDCLLYFSNGRSASITERACKISQFIKNANPELPDEIIAGWMGLPPTVLETMKRDQLRNDQVSEQDD